MLYTPWRWILREIQFELDMGLLIGRDLAKGPNNSLERTQPQRGFMYDVAVLRRSARGRYPELGAAGLYEITGPGPGAVPSQARMDPVLGHRLACGEDGAAGFAVALRLKGSCIARVRSVA